MSAADKLRNNMDAAEYQHVVLGLIFLKYISDPCCGSGGMFVQSEKFIEAHGGQRDQVAICGQESNATTRRLAVMNLAIRGFCKSATTAEIAAHGHVLTPGRYVGAQELADDGDPFEEKMPRLVAELNAQFAESAKLEAAIRANLKGLGYAG